MEPDVLKVAHGIIRGPRRAHYGDPRVNFQAIADMWNAYLASKPAGEPLTGYDVAQFMVLLKVARGARGYHRDSAVDTAGYAALTEVLCDDEAYASFVSPDESPLASRGDDD
jgi:hypothetical protein